jgi:tryptophan-rich sensory protein
MWTRKPSRRLGGLVGWLLFCLATGAIGAIASVNANQFYASLAKPAWAPPAGVFGPVWTVLFCLMGIAAWLAWRRRGFAGASSALSLFITQLAFNALWSWLFFGWHLGALAFAEVLVLWALILATLIAFWRITPWAGALLIPYFAWVTFASALNLAIWRLNPALL